MSLIQVAPGSDLQLLLSVKSLSLTQLLLHGAQSAAATQARRAAAEAVQLRYGNVALETEQQLLGSAAMALEAVAL